MVVINKLLILILIIVFILVYGIIKYITVKNIANIVYKNKICIVMFYTDNIKSYSQLAEQINENYAQKWGYDFHVQYHRESDRAPQWDKVKVISNKLSEYDYIFWIDSDAIITNYNIQLERFINKAPNKNILICDDKPNGGYINTGTMFFKNTLWSKFFLKKWWDLGTEMKYEHKFAHEQDVLKHLLLTNKYNTMDNTKIFNVDDFNTNYPGKMTHNDNKFVLHLMSTTEKERVNTFEKYYKNKFLFQK